jgi:hypothetical protein
MCLAGRHLQKLSVKDICDACAFSTNEPFRPASMTRFHRALPRAPRLGSWAGNHLISPNFSIFHG